MINNVLYDYKSVDDVIALTIVQYGEEEIQEADMLDIYSIVMEEIGNVYPMSYMFSGKMDENGILLLPCNVRAIEGVTAGSDPNYCSRVLNIQLVASQVIEGMQVYNALTGRPMDYLPGRFIDYTFQGDHLLLDTKNRNFTINVHYKGEIVDEKGYPMVTQKDAKAIAAYYMYRNSLKKIKKGINDGGLSQLYKQEYERYVAQARVQPLSQNELNWIKQTATRKDIWKRRRDFKYNY